MYRRREYTQYSQQQRLTSCQPTGLLFPEHSYELNRTVPINYYPKELAHSATALEKQSESLELQNFERSFFSLVEFHNDIVNDMDIRDSSEGDVINQGRDVLRYLFRRKLWGVYENRRKNNSNKKECVTEAYDLFLKENEFHVGHYFRNLYRIFKFVDESKVFDEEGDDDKIIKKKKGYTGIIRAQLSTYELGLLFFNSLHENGASFQKYIKKYALLENFRYLHMEESFNDLKDLYHPDSWGKHK